MIFVANGIRNERYSCICRAESVFVSAVGRLGGWCVDHVPLFSTKCPRIYSYNSHQCPCRVKVMLEIQLMWKCEKASNQLKSWLVHRTLWKTIVLHLSIKSWHTIKLPLLVGHHTLFAHFKCRFFLICQSGK